MRTGLFIILFLGILSICYTGATDLTPSHTQKIPSPATQDNNYLKSDNPSSKLTAALYGAFSAGIITVLIKLGEWYFSRRLLKKNLQRGLYFEIENHKIVELQNDQDSQPNFALASFDNIFYQSNLSNISRILNENLIQRLTFYYSHLKLAFDCQNELRDVNDKINENKSTRSITEDDELYKKREALRETIRLILATAQFIRHNLLAELTKIFGEDPTKLAFIDVLPKYKDWFEGIQKKEK